MNKKDRFMLAKVLGALGMILVLGSFLGMVLGRLSYGWFWTNIVIGAFIGFVVCPRLRGESSSFLEWLSPKR